MPIVVLIIGILLVITGLNNRLTPPASPNLVSLIQDDISPQDGSASFLVWVLAIVFVGMLGFVRELKPISNAFLFLLFLGIFLSSTPNENSGFFANFTKAIQNLGKTNFSGSVGVTATDQSSNPLDPANIAHLIDNNIIDDNASSTLSTGF